jgi:hypothetical protein
MRILSVPLLLRYLNHGWTGVHLWLVVSVISAGFCLAQSSPDLEARFLTEAPQGWQDYREFAERLQGSVVITTKDHGKIIFQRRAEFRSNPKCRMLVFQYLEPKRDETVYAFNSAYEFSIRRKSNDAPWLLTHLEVGKKSMQEKGVLHEEWGVLTFLLNGGGLDVLELVRDQNFRVVSATSVNQDGAELIKIQYARPQPLATEGPRSMAPTIQSGTLLLDPNHFWTNRSSLANRAIRDGNQTLQLKFQLRDVSSRYPIPLRLTQTFENTVEGRKVAQTTELDFDLKELSRLPREEVFRLSAFGLPEPMGVPALSRSYTWLWIILAGFVLLALGLVLHRAARYKRRKGLFCHKG